MIDTLLKFIAPHYCCGCGNIGQSLCDNCINNITTESFDLCAVCTKSAATASGVCKACRPSYERAWVVGRHFGVLDTVIDHYKFNASRGVGDDLAILLDEQLPYLPENVVLVPIPTISSHVRERGFDHMKYLVRKFAAQRKGVRVEYDLLKRGTQTAQRGAKAAQRWSQAKKAFYLKGSIEVEVPYILVDDVMTTGATLEGAAMTLRAAGAKHVWVTALARHVLD